MSSRVKNEDCTFAVVVIVFTQVVAVVVVVGLAVVDCAAALPVAATAATTPTKARMERAEAARILQICGLVLDRKCLDVEAAEALSMGKRILFIPQIDGPDGNTCTFLDVMASAIWLLPRKGPWNVHTDLYRGQCDMAFLEERQLIRVNANRTLQTDPS